MKTFVSLIPAIAFACLCCGAVMVKADYEGRVIFGGIVAYSIFVALILLGLGVDNDIHGVQRNSHGKDRLP